MFHVLFERGNIRVAVGLSGWILPTGILDFIGRRVQTEHEHPWSNSHESYFMPSPLFIFLKA
jgi:hypothetical protein